MKNHIGLSIIFVLLFTGFRVSAQGITAAHSDSLNNLVDKYYDLNLKIFQKNSTVAEIDMLFDIFTADFTYSHPRYGGTYTRDDLYEGYVRNLKNGAYNGTVTDIRILKKITGLNAVVVQKRFVEKTSTGIKEGDPEMTLFEFRDGRISRIIEYW